MMRTGVWLPAALLLACRPAPAGEPAPEPAPDIETPSAEEEPPSPAGNHASELVAASDRITTVVIVDPEGQPLGELSASVVDGLRENVQSGLASDISATTPPWDIALQISVPGRPAFIAIPVGIDRARLNPMHPYDARFADENGEIDPRVQEVRIGEPAHEAIAVLMGPATAKEYQKRPTNSPMERN